MEYLLLTAVESLKILAISGSIWIMRSFCTATLEWRFSICFFTHLLKTSPSTDAMTLHIHCLGVLGISSLGSGKYLNTF